MVTRTRQGDGQGSYGRLRRELARRLGASEAYVLALPMPRVMGILGSGATVVETLTKDPPIACNDLRAWGRRARESGSMLVVDNTSAGFVACAAARLGTCLSVEPLGPGLTLVGMSPDARASFPEVTRGLEALPLPDDGTSGELLQQVAAREESWRSASDVAQVVACYLTCHPSVSQVRYPGLKGDPSFEVAARTLVGGFGACVDFRLGDASPWMRWEASPGDDAREAVLALEGRLATRPA